LGLGFPTAWSQLLSVGTITKGLSFEDLWLNMRILAVFCGCVAYFCRPVVARGANRRLDDPTGAALEPWRSQRSAFYTMGQFVLLATPVLLVLQLLSGAAAPMESMPIWLQHVMRIISPTAHFVAFSQAVLSRGADLAIVWLCSSQWRRSAASTSRWA